MEMRFWIMVICLIWLTESSDFISRSARREQETSTEVRSTKQRPKGQYSHWDCDLAAQPDAYYVNGKSIIDKWKYFQNRPLCRWDCALYKMKAELLYTDEDIAQAETRTAIFTWLNVYDPDSNIAKEKIAVNSIIAIAFWVATGLPAFIAFIIFCFDRDLHESPKPQKKEVKEEGDKDVNNPSNVQNSQGQQNS